MKEVACGALAKMTGSLGVSVEYALPVGNISVPLNALIGKTIRLAYAGIIECVYCGRAIHKSFNQGYCYPCFQKLARCDGCIMSPEKCHYEQGTCREPDWAQQHCLVDHVVYLANTSGPKVGITRATQIPTRWIDQGAIQALPVMRVSNRHQSGVIEHALKAYVADKTSWQTMLKGQVSAVNLPELKVRLLSALAVPLRQFQQSFGNDALNLLDDKGLTDITYPVMTYPAKVKSLDFDKQPCVEGVLQGIKGQYLLLDTGVLNIRKFTAYQVALAI